MMIKECNQFILQKLMHIEGAKDLVIEKKWIKCYNIMKWYKNDDITKENMKEHNPNWLLIPDYPYRLLLTGSSGSGKTNLLFNPISHPPHIDKIDLYPTDPYEAKYQLLINKRESTGLGFK